MFFILSNSLVFDPDTQRLSLAGQPESEVTLSAPAVRLLLEFIRNKGEELSREALITRVWQDFGYTPSGNNLNKAVSELRKAFKSLGVHVSPIVTVPGKGFYFDADVTGQKHLPKAAAIETAPPPNKTTPLKKKAKPLNAPSLLYCGISSSNFIWRRLFAFRIFDEFTQIHKTAK